jgi:uncharacterized protein YecE (DUF72 family)
MVNDINSKDSAGVIIGMGGWNIPSFNGIFYPLKSGKGFRRLQFYSRYFDLVEVNATFYNTAFSPAQAQQWLKDVEGNKNFIFTAKLFRGFTHTFDATKNDAITIHRLLDPLREANRFGGLVIQFPSSFDRSDSRQAYLLKLRSIFPEDKLFLDLRHNSWNTESIYKFCREQGFNLINVDLPPLPGHMPLNSFAWDKIAYFRMMGRNAKAWKSPGKNDRYLYEYSEEELKDIVQRIKQAGADRTYIVFHNDVQAFSMVNGRQIEHALYPAKHIFAPAKLLGAFPQLKSFCDLREANDTVLTSRQNPLPLH